MFENFNPPQELIPSDPRFASGPSLVPPEFLKSLAETGTGLMGTSHRKPAVKNLVKEVSEGLAQYFKFPEDRLVVYGNGGATAFFDTAALGLVQKKVTHFTCGEFSEKWFKSSQAVPWIEAKQQKVDYGKGVSPCSDDDADVICWTLNETSTGVMAPPVPGLKREGQLVLVDGTSGAGQIEVDFSQVDVLFFSPQKVFASDGGLWVGIFSPEAVERALNILSDSSRYIPPIMNLKLAIDNARKNQTYNTPAIATLFLLNEQVKRLNAYGYKEAKTLAAKKADLVYNWAESKPYLSCYISEPKYRSHAVATIDVDEKYPAGELISRLEKLGIVNGIDAYRKLGRNQFRIALFHNISFEDLEKLTKLISLAIEKE